MPRCNGNNIVAYLGWYAVMSFCLQFDDYIIIACLEWHAVTSVLAVGGESMATLLVSRLMDLIISIEGD